MFGYSFTGHPHLLKNRIYKIHLLCKYIVWSSLLIYLCHLRLFLCVIISFCDFHCRGIDDLCISVNVNIPLVQLLEILEKQTMQVTGTKYH